MGEPQAARIHNFDVIVFLNAFIPCCKRNLKRRSSQVPPACSGVLLNIKLQVLQVAAMCGICAGY
ncbi:MAG: hypothetical protein P4L77_02480 [Sulfuriferula sp.]|nr:hypothetical protein [Sulfuriferula sp.]